MLGGQDQRLTHVTPIHHDRPVDPSSVQHRYSIGGELASPIGVIVAGAVGAAFPRGSKVTTRQCLAR
jgi:hypothetical protein